MQVRGKCMSVFLSWTDECFKFVAASSNSLLTCIRSIILRLIWTPLKPICWAKGKAGISFCRNKNKRETLKSVRWVQEKMIWLIYPAELKAASVTITIKPEPQSEFFFHPHHSHEELLTSLTVHKKKRDKVYGSSHGASSLWSKLTTNQTGSSCMKPLAQTDMMTSEIAHILR